MSKILKEQVISPIEHRLSVAINLDIVNGDQFERSIFVTQVGEAVNTIKFLRAEVERLREALVCADYALRNPLSNQAFALDAIRKALTEQESKL